MVTPICPWPFDNPVPQTVALNSVPPEQPLREVAGAMHTVREAIHKDDGYAISWHANLAMAFRDSGVCPAVAQKGAALFMQRCFGRDTSCLS